MCRQTLHIILTANPPQHVHASIELASLFATSDNQEPAYAQTAGTTLAPNVALTRTSTSFCQTHSPFQTPQQSEPVAKQQE